MQKWTTYTASAQTQLTNAGYRIVKNSAESLWQVVDGSKVVMSNKALGDLMKIASKQFGI